MLRLIDHRHVSFGTLVQWVASGIVIATGVLGQISDAPGSSLHGYRFDLHGWFAVLLCAAIMARFNWGLWRLAGTSRDAIARFSRQMNRWVYLLLYGLIGVKVIYGLEQALGPLQGFQPYLASGILAIFLNQGLAAASQWRCASRKPPVATPDASMAARTRTLSSAANSSAWR